MTSSLATRLPTPCFFLTGIWTTSILRTWRLCVSYLASIVWQVRPGRTLYEIFGPLSKRYCDVTTRLRWRHYLSTMTSLLVYDDVTTRLRWRHYSSTICVGCERGCPLYCDVTDPLLWRHCPLLLPPLLWRHCPLYCVITNTIPSTMTFLPPLLWHH